MKQANDKSPGNRPYRPAAGGGPDRQAGSAAIDIRRASSADAQRISALVVDGFGTFIAPDYGEEGRRTFLAYVGADAIASRLAQDGTQGFVAVHPQDGIVGYVEFAANHISLFFVAPAHQRAGIGGTLLRAGLRGHADVDVTVNAAPYSLPIYRRLGFRAVGDWATRDGIRYLRMQRSPAGPRD